MFLPVLVVLVFRSSRTTATATPVEKHPDITTVSLRAPAPNRRFPQERAALRLWPSNYQENPSNYSLKQTLKCGHKWTIPFFCRGT